MLAKFKDLVLIIMIFLIPMGCQDISPKEVIRKGGLVYKIGDDEPYTGTVSGYAREGYRRCKMKYEKRYKAGIQHGDTRFWYPNGKLESVEPYSNGRINGIITRYYSSGKIKARLHIVNDQRGGSKGERFWDAGHKSGGLGKRVFN